MFIKNSIFLLLVLLFLSCSSVVSINYFESIALISKRIDITEEELKIWYHQNIVKDSLPGISLNEAYSLDFLSSKKGKQVVVAVLDTEVDINHEDLKDQIWQNIDEIPNNNIDDDENGYVDDINGWNFLVNKNGESLIRSNYEFVRIINNYKSKFGDPTKEIIIDEKQKNSSEYKLYSDAVIKYNEKLKSSLKDQEYGNFLYNNYPKSKKLLKKIFPLEDYTVTELDSLYKTYKEEKEKANLIYFMSDFMKYNLSKEWIDNYKKNADARIEKSLNLDYNPRYILGDDPDDINDNNYGSGNLTRNIDIFNHGTYVAGIIAAKRNNNIGINGIYDKIKIMPLSISCSGDEYDKDIAIAIRYAVDNGANIINMSFAKEFSLKDKWVKEAIIYAAENDVLIVGVASNENLNIDNNFVYPNDFDQSGDELVKNFIVVGSISHNLDKNFKSFFSNYGKKNVDIFAPGEKIYTTESNNKYGFQSGTSVAAPMVTGIAGLIKGYYPHLRMSEIKEIILKSGTIYQIDVEIEQKDGTKKLVPFSELSKSGKVVNAYNALLLAEKISKQK